MVFEGGFINWDCLNDEILVIVVLKITPSCNIRDSQNSSLNWAKLDFEFFQVVSFSQAKKQETNKTKQKKTIATSGEAKW